MRYTRIYICNVYIKRNICILRLFLQAGAAVTCIDKHIQCSHKTSILDLPYWYADDDGWRGDGFALLHSLYIVSAPMLYTNMKIKGDRSKYPSASPLLLLYTSVFVILYEIAFSLVTIFLCYSVVSLLFAENGAFLIAKELTKNMIEKGIRNSRINGEVKSVCARVNVLVSIPKQNIAERKKWEWVHIKTKKVLGIVVKFASIIFSLLLLLLLSVVANTDVSLLHFHAFQPCVCVVYTLIFCCLNFSLFLLCL